MFIAKKYIRLTLIACIALTAVAIPAVAQEKSEYCQASNLSGWTLRGETVVKLHTDCVYTRIGSVPAVATFPCAEYNLAGQLLTNWTRVGTRTVICHFDEVL